MRQRLYHRHAGHQAAGIVPRRPKADGNPAEAFAAGADYLVIGRPVLEAPDPVQAAREIIAEVQRAGHA